MLDITILCLLSVAGVVGFGLGLVRQLSVSIGMVSGLIAVALVYSRLAFLAEASAARTIVLLLLLCATGFLFFDIFLRLGNWLHKKAHRGTRQQQLSRHDRTGGSVVAVIAGAAMVWFTAAILSGTSITPVRQQIDGSGFLRIVDAVSEKPGLVRALAQALSPFSAPEVFAGQEPVFESATPIGQEFESLDAAIKRVRPVSFRINSWGCGSSTAGSGFLVDSRLVATNAHVIVGASRISIRHPNGTSYAARPVVFDAKNDMAILRTEVDLPGNPTVLASKILAPGMIGATLGYTDEAFSAGDAIVLEVLDAEGYDIYQQERVVRRVYAVRGSVVSGNSGGPLITAKGEVAGMVFGYSSMQARTGYAITADTLADGLEAAKRQVGTVTAGECRGET